MTDEDRQKDEFDEFRAELSQVERRVSRRIDPGLRGVRIAVAVLVLLVTAVLPWIGDTAGWQVLFGGAGVGVLPVLFAGALLGVGVVGSALALALRNWALSWVCALGSCVAAVLGMLSIWTQQTGRVPVPGQPRLPGPGPSFGLVIAEFAAIALAIMWLRVASTRP
ncbi:Rv2732c family membrane protein [Allokutzneria oryzae]|uniref:Transmembrane protein n=1 Tax=Allokutzneria oryzae TaxID=1378989 RepID=A0ABV5ZQS8_9PSEU